MAMLLDIETRIGEIIETTPVPPPKVTDRSAKGRIKASSRGTKRPEGVSKHRAYQAQAIAKHPEIVKKVKARAKENEDIPQQRIGRDRLL